MKSAVSFALLLVFGVMVQDISCGCYSTYVTCSSRGYAYVLCNVGYPIQYVNVHVQQSSSPCTQGSTWGHTYTQIWVYLGCRAVFVTVYCD